MIQLLASGARRAAAELEQAFPRLHERVRQRERVLQGTTAARWLLFTEASSLHGVLPTRIYRALLDVLLGGDPQRAFKAIDHFAQYRQDAATRAMRTLRARAPNLYDLIGSPRIEKASGVEQVLADWPVPDSGPALHVQAVLVGDPRKTRSAPKRRRRHDAPAATPPSTRPPRSARPGPWQDLFKAHGQRQLAELAGTHPGRPGTRRLQRRRHPSSLADRCHARSRSLDQRSIARARPQRPRVLRRGP